MAWWGIYLVAASTPAGRFTIPSPLLMHFLLVRVSGVALLEKKLTKSREGYREYAARTNAFLPWFPRNGG
jgi:steroid 5-alpha reductase family enzyme